MAARELARSLADVERRLGEPIESGETVLAAAEACRAALRATLSEAARSGRDFAPSEEACGTIGRALLHLGGVPERSVRSLRDYDHDRYGPFLGVSDEGSAGAVIARAAFDSPKGRVLGERASPLTLGMALDAERLGAIGEVVVGPDEYAQVWPQCAGRVLMSTNVGTRANLRLYMRRPRLQVRAGRADALAQARGGLDALISPFLQALGAPRPFLIFVEFTGRASVARKRALLRGLRAHLIEVHGEAVAAGGLGVAERIPAGKPGRARALQAIGLCASASIAHLELEGPVSPTASAAISLPGLMHYLGAAGLVGPILRAAQAARVTIHVPNIPDPDTVARSISSGLSTARSMGLDLAKYGLVPLTLEESAGVVSLVQGWFDGWSAAPVFYVDQGILQAGSIDIHRDVRRGLHAWLTMVGERGVRVVLVDTLEKASGIRLVNSARRGPGGRLGFKQIADLDQHARAKRVKALWAGSLDLFETYELGKLGVFGVYVTSSASEARPVGPAYAADHALLAEKEPTYEGVLRTKRLLEAGFLVGRLEASAPSIATEIDGHARRLLAGGGEAAEAERSLAEVAERGWRRHLGRRR